MKKSSKPSVSVWVGLLVAFAAVSAAFAATEVAKVNGKVITLEEFNKKYQALLPLYQNKTPTKQTVLEDIVKRELGVQEAKKQGLEKDPEVQEEINTVLYQALLRKQLQKDFEKISITDTDARAWYNKNPEIRTSHIFVPLAPGASKEEEASAYARIKEIQNKELKSGKSFAEVAQKFSEGVAAPMGGDIDYQGKSQLDPAYYSAALALRTPGKVSGIVRSQFGLHLIKLTAIRPWSEVDPAAIRQEVFNERKQALFDNYMKGLRSRAQVTVKNDLVK
ncbi:MAG: peptidylprolyl isomerase [Bdellovibrionales bacterium]|nr:peptidylprolyl isomerase [Bdellovibrionales bacterium]